MHIVSTYIVLCFLHWWFTRVLITLLLLFLTAPILLHAVIFFLCFCL